MALTNERTVPDPIERLVMEGMMRAISSSLDEYGVPGHIQISMLVSLVAENIKQISTESHPLAMEVLAFYLDFLHLMAKTQDHAELMALLESRERATRGEKPS